ncbi:MAG: ABC transporter permease, partial [Armatimonadetes bacterium]|nr:ABC transporter permease [Armatimonadota bacterium]
MSRLHTKLWRDVRAGIWQLLAISVVSSLGVAVYMGLMIAYENQKLSYAISYEALRFADVTVAMRRAPRAVVRQMALLPGVRAVEGRIVLDLELEQDRGRRPRVTGRLVTLPEGREPDVNRIRVLRGRGLAPGPQREVLLEASFAEKHGYQPGDRLFPVLQGRRVAFRVAGIVSSPEYIYAVQSKQFLMPTPALFGVLFVRQSQVESLLGMSGSVNELVFLTDPGAGERVGYAAMRRLRAYGSQDPMTRKEQPSNLLLQSDLDGYKPTAVTMPALFLGTAALAVSMVLARWAQGQRGQIGFLRASGFRPIAILVHFLELGLVAGAGGGLLGIVLGMQFAGWIGALYEQLLHIPYHVQDPHPEIGLNGFLLSLFCCGLGAFGPARQAALLPPAEAMRGQAPSQPRLAARLRLPL